MKNNKSASTQWLILGAVILLITFAYAYIDYSASSSLFSNRLSYFGGMIVGPAVFAGMLFLAIGIVKLIIEKTRK